MDFKISDAPPFSEVKTRREKYPWNDLEIGKGFIIPVGTIQFSTAVSLAQKASKRFHKQFKAIDGGANGIMIARYDDPAPKEDIKVRWQAQIGKIVNES